MKATPDISRTFGLSFAGKDLLIRTDTALVEDIAHFVFGPHLRQVDAATCQSMDVLSDGCGGFQFLLDGQLVALAMDETELAVMLMQTGQRQLIFRQNHHAMLHAAVLVRNGCGFLFPAAAGSGKTTLTAWLLGHGYGLLSDELASVGPNGEIDGFTRPLNIKPGSRSLLDAFDWMLMPLTQSRVSCGVTLVPWRRKSAEKITSSVIICVSYVANAPFSVERLSPGLCARDLMGSLLNARNLPKHGLAFATRFAAEQPRYRIRYSQVEDVSTWLEQQQHFAPHRRDGEGTHE